MMGLFVETREIRRHNWRPDLQESRHDHLQSTFPSYLQRATLGTGWTFEYTCRLRGGPRGPGCDSPAITAVINGFGLCWDYCTSGKQMLLFNML